jgi:hypothetical protein
VSPIQTENTRKSVGITSKVEADRLTFYNVTSKQGMALESDRKEDCIASRIMLKWLRGKFWRTERGCAVKFRKLPLSCECGGIPKHISGVGLSTDHAFVIHWRCPRCHRDVCVIKPLTDCWRDCPTESEANTNSAKVMETSNDRRFLHSVGVRYPDE